MSGQPTTIMPRYRQAREQAGLTLEQAAKYLGWARGPLLAIESGVGHPPTEDEQRHMADVYGCSMQWLRGDHVEPPADLVRALRDAEVSDHDRDIVLEFAASIQGKPPVGTPRERLEAVARRRSPEADQPVSRKRRYVARQGQTRDHHCHWPGCAEQVPPAMWGCRRHWFALPKALRDRVWRTYAPGQEVDGTPSEEYLQVADDVQRWIRENASPQPKASR